VLLTVSSLFFSERRKSVMTVNRRILKTGIVLLACVALLSATAEAQNQRRQGGRRGPSRFGGGGQIGKSLLLGNEKVQKELKISEDQKSKITTVASESRPNSRELFSGLRDLSEEERRAKFQEIREKFRKLAQEADKKISEILTDSQNKRLGEILLQLRGLNALTDKELAGKLKITADQQQSIKDLFEAQRDMQREFYSGLRDLSQEERRKKFEELRTKGEDLRKETETAVLGVLSASQKTAFENMKGEKFEIDRRSLFRGFGRGNRGNRGDGNRGNRGDGNRGNRGDGNSRRPRRPSTN
jgi:Spy/CpxP family protein refolding chaperone